MSLREHVSPATKLHAERMRRLLTNKQVLDDIECVLDELRTHLERPPVAWYYKYVRR